MFGLDLILKLKPACYFYNNKIDKLNDGKKHFGLIAQDINEVLDQEIYSVVHKKGEYLTVDYVSLIAPMIKSIQELNKEIELMKIEIKTLKSEKEISPSE